jgi:hypothetical protein
VAIVNFVVFDFPPTFDCILVKFASRSRCFSADKNVMVIILLINE